MLPFYEGCRLSSTCARGSHPRSLHSLSGRRVDAATPVDSANGDTRLPTRDPTSENKAVVTRLVNDVINAGRLDLIDELYTATAAPAVRDWIVPFLRSFPDVHMEIIELIAESDKVVGRFTCTATHQTSWLGHAPTGRRFENIDEVSIFTFQDGRIADTWSLEDTHERLRQLGLSADQQSEEHQPEE